MAQPFKSRIFHLRVSTLVSCVLGLIAFIHLLAFYGTYNYIHIPREDLPKELYKETSYGRSKAKADCDYEDILKSEKSVRSRDVRKKAEFSISGIVNGSFVPERCRARFSVAVLVAYRDRPEQLALFLPYMHNFLRKQNIHYK